MTLDYFLLVGFALVELVETEFHIAIEGHFLTEVAWLYVFVGTFSQMSGFMLQFEEGLAFGVVGTLYTVERTLYLVLGQFPVLDNFFAGGVEEAPHIQVIQ